MNGGWFGPRFRLSRLALMIAISTVGAVQPGAVSAASALAADTAAPVAATGQPPTTPGACDPRSSLRPLGPLPRPGQMPAESAMARIAGRGRLIAAVNQNTFLFGYRDPNTGELNGFDVDIARDIAGAIFGDRGRVEFRPVAVADRLKTVESGDVDLAASTMTITCDRRARVEFSAVYYEAGQRVLVNRGSPVTGLESLGNRLVCAARGSTSLQRIATAPSRPVPVGVPNTADCLVLLQLGKVDAISTDDTLLAGLAAQDPRTVIVGPRISEEPYGVAISRAAPDLVRFVNAVLERRIASNEWRASYLRWLTLMGPPPAPPQPRYRD